VSRGNSSFISCRSLHLLVWAWPALVVHAVTIAIGSVLAGARPVTLCTEKHTGKKPTD
jgi:hypothetical protein